MVIRTERSSDYETVYNLVKRAFERAEHRDGNAIIEGVVEYAKEFGI